MSGSGRAWQQDFDDQIAGKNLESYWKKQMTNEANNRSNLLDDAFANFALPQTVTLEEANDFLGVADEYWEVFMEIKPEGFPSGLHEHMVRRRIPYGIKGVLWYQGESDDTDSAGRFMTGC